jgi:hypothetical protein
MSSSLLSSPPSESFVFEKISRISRSDHRNNGYNMTSSGDVKEAITITLNVVKDIKLRDLKAEDVEKTANVKDLMNDAYELVKNNVTIQDDLKNDPDFKNDLDAAKNEAEDKVEDVSFFYC